MTYIVVYENDQSTGLHYGCRYYVEHNSEQDANKKHEQGTSVVAKGITVEEAIKLSSLSPEICLVASIIDKYGVVIGPNNFHLVEIEAKYILQEVRATIATSNLTRIDATPYIERLKTLSKEDSYQASCLNAYIIRIVDEYTGQIYTNY